MHFSTIVNLCLLFLIYQRVDSSGHSLSQNETFFKGSLNNMLKKFFIDLNKAYLEKNQPRHITVVGASSNQLQQTQPLFETYPYSICKGPERCAYSHQFSQGSLVIIFLEDLSEETFGKNINILSGCRRCKILFISNGISIQVDDVWSIFTLALEHVPYSEFAHVGKNVIKLYSDFVGTNCSMEVRMVTAWRPGVRLDKISIWITRTRNMNGCPVFISSLIFTPKMMIEEDENGSLTVVGGREGNLVLALAKKLNFTIALRYPSMENQLKYSRKEAIINEVASGVSEIGIGRLRPTNNLDNTIALSFWYDEECVTWGVPRVINWSNEIVWVEFTWEVWVSIALVFAVSCIIRYAHRIIVTSKNDQEKSLGVVMIFFDAVLIHLGNPVMHVSTTAGGRFLLVAFLYYAIVITTAYKSSLASILTTDEGTPSITDVKGIIDANLKLGGSLYDYDILKDQVDDSELNPKLIERFVVDNNDSVSWDRLMFNNDYAFLARRSALDHHRQDLLKRHETVPYSVLNGCVLAYTTVIVFQKESLLREPVDNIIWHLMEAGILKHWDFDYLDAEKLLKRKIVERYFEERGTHKFRNIFLLYFFCIAVALFTFLLELLIPKFDPRKQQHIAN